MGTKEIFAIIKILASRSAKVAALLKENQIEEAAALIRKIPSLFGPKSFKDVLKFCDGECSKLLSCDNVIPVACLARFLDMNEHYSKNNLLSLSLIFFQQKVLPSWNNTIKALKSTTPLADSAAQLGFIEDCIEALVDRACTNPRQLKSPVGCETETLASLPLKLFEPIIRAMQERHVESSHVASSVMEFATHYVYSTKEIEAVERMLPEGNRLCQVPTTSMLKLLKEAMKFDASSACRLGFERRIAKQLKTAKVEDLMMICECENGIESVRRMLKLFFSGLRMTKEDIVSVGELMEELLIAISRDDRLKKEEFVALAEASKAATAVKRGCSDGIYKALNGYLEKHGELTEEERRELCKVLEIGRLSDEAMEHAAMNAKLPERTVMQVMYAEMRRRGAVKDGFEGGHKHGVWSGMKRKLRCGNIEDCDREVLIRKKRKGDKLCQ